MCVACPYIGSEGSTARKSALRASTFLHPALVNIILSVEKRRLSLSKAYSCRVGVHERHSVGLDEQHIPFPCSALAR